MLINTAYTAVLYCTLNTINGIIIKEVVVGFSFGKIRMKSALLISAAQLQSHQKMILEAQTETSSLVHVVVILQSLHRKAPQRHTGDELTLTRPVGSTAGSTRGKRRAAVVCRRHVGPPHRHAPIFHIGTVLRLLRQVGFRQLQVVRSSQGCASLLVAGGEEVMRHQRAELRKRRGRRSRTQVQTVRRTSHVCRRLRR